METGVGLLERMEFQAKTIVLTGAEREKAAWCLEWRKIIDSSLSQTREGSCEINVQGFLTLFLGQTGTKPKPIALPRKKFQFFIKHRKNQGCVFLWLEYLTLCQGRRILGLAGQKWYRAQSNLYYQTPKESKSSNFLKGPLFRLTWRLLWWPAFNIPSNTSFSDGPVCLLSLARCGELNMPLIFICAVQTASTYIPLREITKINAGWHILNEETNRNIYFSVHTPQCLLRVRTNWQQQYRIPSGYRLSQWRPVM